MATLPLLIALLSTQQVMPAADRAPIERVTVLADRAEVTRVLHLECSGKPAEVELPGLPSSIDTRTLRAEAKTPGKVLGMVQRRAPVSEGQDPRHREATLALRAVDDRIVGLNDQVENARARSTAVGGFASFVEQVVKEALRDPKAKPDDWKKTFEVLLAADTTARKHVVELSAQLRQAKEERERAAAKLEQLGERVNQEAVFVKLVVDCGGAPATARVSYVVPGATWHPEYDLRFFPERGAKIGPGRVRLSVSAIVQQASGEDWNNARLVLSTAKPALGARAPYPAPLILDGQKGAKEKVLVSAQERRESLQEGAAAEADRPRSAALEDGGKAVSFVLPHGATVKSDGRPYWVPIDDVDGRGEAKLVAFPKLESHVYQVLSTTNFASYPLLAGRAHTHRGGSYVGDGTLKYLGPGEPIELSLGLDDEIAVERMDLKELDRTPGLLSSTKKLERAYRIYVENRAKTAVKVEVREAIPVSKDKAIEVELKKEQTTPNHRFDAIRGFVSFSVDLPASARKSVDLSYTVKLPDDWQVAPGGPR